MQFLFCFPLTQPEKGYPTKESNDLHSDHSWMHGKARSNSRGCAGLAMFGNRDGQCHNCHRISELQTVHVPPNEYGMETVGPSSRKDIESPISSRLQSQIFARYSSETAQVQPCTGRPGMSAGTWQVGPLMRANCAQPNI